MSRGWFSVFTGLAIGFVLLAAPLRGQFAYVANFESNNVSAYSIDGSNGTLTPIPGSPFAAGSNPISVAVDPTGKFAYVANFVGSAYSIGSNGALTPIPGSPFAVTNSSDNVSAYRIGSDGTLVRRSEREDNRFQWLSPDWLGCNWRVADYHCS
jgi:DNA-binding beta-propeller fold protein YncE